MSGLPDKLRRAVLNNDYEAVSDCIAARVDVNAADERGETALHMAMRMSGGLDLLPLFDAGADPNKADCQGITPFMAAVNAGRFPNALIAIDRKADVNFQPAPSSMPPLYYAMYYDAINATTVRTAFLLERGANLDAAVLLEDGHAKTLVEFAVEFDRGAGSEKLYKLILNHLNRDIREEFAKAVAGKSAHARIVSVLSAHSKADNGKFKL